MTLFCLRPGWTELVSVETPSPQPLGSILVVPHAIHGVAQFAETVRFWRSSPWCPTVVVGSRDVVASSINELRPPPMPILASETGTFPAARQVREMVRRRPIPDSADLAAYVMHRCSVSCGALFLAVVHRVAQADTLRRRARVAGRFSPHDWVVVDRCVKAVARAMASGYSEEVTACAIQIDVKTLSSWCTRSFGSGWKSLLAIGSWEGVLEKALRHGGYATERQGSLRRS